MKASSDKIAKSNSNIGHKNILYREKSKDYYLQISKDGKRLALAFNTLEDALAARDKAFLFYSQSGHLPTRDDLNVKTHTRRTLHRQNSSKLGRCIVFDDVASIRPYRVRIRRDNQTFLQNLETLEEAIKRRDEVLKFYDEQGRMPSREEQENIFDVRFKARKYNKSSKSRHSNVGYRNITFNITIKRYFVEIQRKSQKFSINVDTLEEAIGIRDEVLKFYDAQHRLPTKSEYRTLSEQSNN